MKVQYVLGGSDGDHTLTPKELARPFLLSRSTPHPTLTLGGYFETLKGLFLKKAQALFPQDLGIEGQDPWDGVRELILRSEKHGAFHHVARAEIHTQGEILVLGMLTAVSDRGRNTLAREFENLKLLGSKPLSAPFLPRPLSLQMASGPSGEPLTVMLVEWLEGFHEWHMHRVPATGEIRPVLWEEGRNRPLGPDEAFGLWHEAARILTLCYDPLHFSQVRHWHHAAGDVVARVGPDAVKARLVTIRDYRPLPLFEGRAPSSPWIPLVYFFLDLALQTRLDRLEGTGEAVWLPRPCLEATVQGFLKGVAAWESLEQGGDASPPEVHSLLGSFSVEELGRIYASLLEVSGPEDPEERSLLEENLPVHLQECTELLQP